MSLMLISPAQAVVIAAVDGVWDAREQATADRARADYAQTVNFPETILAADLVLESPDVFRRFVSYSVASRLPGQLLPVVSVLRVSTPHHRGLTTRTHLPNRRVTRNTILSGFPIVGIDKGSVRHTGSSKVEVPADAACTVAGMPTEGRGHAVSIERSLTCWGEPGQ